MPLLVAISHNPLIIALGLVGFAALWVLAAIHVRYASGWQLLSEFFCEPMDRSGGDDAGVSMGRTERSCCGGFFRVKLDVENGYLCLQGPRIAGGYFKPMRIPLSRFRPKCFVMCVNGFSVETSGGGASVAFVFDADFTKRMMAAIAPSNVP